MPFRLTDVGTVYDELGLGLIHAAGGGCHTRPHAGNPGDLHQALDGAVLAVGPVHDGKYHVDGHMDRAAVLEENQAVAPGG